MARPVCHRAAWRCASVSGVLHTPSPHQTHKPLTDCRRSAAEPTRAPSPQQHIHTQRTQPHRRQHLNQRHGLAWPGLVRSLSPSSRPKSHGSSITPMHALAWGISTSEHRHESQAQDYSTAQRSTREPGDRAHAPDQCHFPLSKSHSDSPPSATKTAAPQEGLTWLDGVHVALCVQA
jgi:hypothetical protein